MTKLNQHGVSWFLFLATCLLPCHVTAGENNFETTERHSMGEVWRKITPFSLIHIYPLSAKQQTRILFVKRKGLQMVLKIHIFCLKNRNTNKTHLVRIDIYSGLHQKVNNLLNCVQLHKVKVTVLKSTTPKNRSYPKFELSFLREWCVIGPVMKYCPDTQSNTFDNSFLRQFFLKLCILWRHQEYTIKWTRFHHAWNLH